MIKKLDNSSILNLCVNQVIIDLATCVKELVENSLDAKSTKIEIHLKEYGKEGVEVIDNGIGIDMENLEGIAQKGATSKLRVFEDLDNLQTFGFRGEALNAISILSKLTITTCTQKQQEQDQSIGLRYTFNQDNTLNSKQKVAREMGTTICLQDLFGGIPVRKQEFIKNIISQFNKLVNLLTEYALIATHAQIILINTTSKKGREIIINSGVPTPSMLGKISCILTKKIADMLVDVSFEFENSCKVEGFVLKQIESGSGRETKFVQKNMTFFYANSRPINPPKKVNSIFSEIYRKYNLASKFIYVLNMHLPKDSIDFNLSPDKRDVFFKQENEFYAALRDHLTQLFERISSIPKSLQNNKKVNSDRNSPEEEECIVPRKSQLLQQQILPFQPTQNEEIIRQKPKISELREQSTNQFSKTTAAENSNSHTQNSDYFSIAKERLSSSQAQGYSLKEYKQSQQSDSSKYKVSVWTSSESKENQDKSSNRNIKEDDDNESFEKMNQKLSKLRESKAERVKEIVEEKEEKIVSIPFAESNKNQIKVFEYAIKDLSSKVTKQQVELEEEEEEEVESHCCMGDKEENEKHTCSRGDHIDNEEPLRQGESREDIEEQQSSQSSKKMEQEENEDHEQLKELIQEEQEEAEVLEEAGRQFHKQDFAVLKILGQFNKAFVVAEWKEKNEVYLIDQHASDEKTNYEKLLKNNVFSSQQLINPIRLALTAQEADLLESSRDVFTRNGFSFKIEKDEVSSQQGGYSLIIDRLPASKHVQFDINDFDEIFQHLGSEHNDTTTFRPKKIQRILASKACRSSIMVGTALSHSQMKNILLNLSQLQSPWNCPHGRPTMVKTYPLEQLCNQTLIKRNYDV